MRAHEPARRRVREHANPRVRKPASARECPSTRARKNARARARKQARACASPRAHTTTRVFLHASTRARARRERVNTRARELARMHDHARACANTREHTRAREPASPRAHENASMRAESVSIKKQGRNLPQSDQTGEGSSLPFDSALFFLVRKTHKSDHMPKTTHPPPHPAPPHPSHLTNVATLVSHIWIPTVRLKIHG